MTIANNLSRENCSSLLAAVGSMPGSADAQAQAEEYNWNQPYCFSDGQLKRLNSFVKKVAAKIAREFSDLCRDSFTVTIDSISQHFAHEFLDQILESDQQDYYLAFGSAQEDTSGIVRVPIQSASAWTTQLLGDSEASDDPDKALSQLEESLLYDVVCSIVKAVSDSFKGYDFKATTGVMRGQLPIDFEDTEELCKITFTINRADSEQSQAEILMLCGTLEPVVGKESQDSNAYTAADISDAVVDRIKCMSTVVTGELGSTVVSLEQLMSLHAGDTLLLDRKVGDPIELVANGRTVLFGQPAKSAGKYAVVITESPGT